MLPAIYYNSIRAFFDSNMSLMCKFFLHSVQNDTTDFSHYATNLSLCILFSLFCLIRTKHYYIIIFLKHIIIQHLDKINPSKIQFLQLPTLLHFVRAQILLCDDLTYDPIPFTFQTLFRQCVETYRNLYLSPTLRVR